MAVNVDFRKSLNIKIINNNIKRLYQVNKRIRIIWEKKIEFIQKVSACRFYVPA